MAGASRSSPARPASPAAISLERLLDAGAAVARLVESRERRPPSRGRPASRWDAVDLLDARRVARRASARSAVRRSITAPASPTSADPGRRPARALQRERPRHAPPARGVRARGPRRAACSSPAPRWSTGRPRPRITEDAPIGAGQPVRRQQAGAGDARARDSALPVLLARPFNHTGPRQPPSYATSAFARQIAEIEAGRARAGAAGRQPRRAARHHRRARHRARLPALAERGAPRRPYNVCSGARTAIGDCSTSARRLARVQRHHRVDPARLRPSDNPVILGDHARLDRRDRLGAGDPDRADARRSARLLAASRSPTRPRA